MEAIWEVKMEKKKEEKKGRTEKNGARTFYEKDASR